MNVHTRARGFTLIELLVVISIVSLLSSVVLTSLNTARGKAGIAAGKHFAQGLYGSMSDRAIGAWDFDECSGSATEDKSGTGNTGTLYLGASMSSTTVLDGYGCSLSLDGVDDYVLVSTNELSDAEGSVFAWAYPTAIASNAYVFQGNPDSLTNRLYLHWGSNFAVYRSNPSTGIILRTNAPLNTWHHIGVAWKDGVMSGYYNGTLIGTATFTQLGVGWTTSFIGKQDGGGKNFPGYIDGVRMFSKSLSASEAGKLYAEGLRDIRLAGRP